MKMQNKYIPEERSNTSLQNALTVFPLTIMNNAELRSMMHEDPQPIQTTAPSFLITELAFETFGVPRNSNLWTHPHLDTGPQTSATREEIFSFQEISSIVELQWYEKAQQIEAEDNL